MKHYALCGKSPVRRGSGRDGTTQGEGEGTKVCNDWHLDFTRWRKGFTK